MHHCKILNNVVHVSRTRVELVYLQVLMLCVVLYRGGTPQDKGQCSEPLVLEEASSHLTVGVWCLPADDPCFV